VARPVHNARRASYTQVWGFVDLAHHFPFCSLILAVTPAASPVGLWCELEEMHATLYVSVPAKWGLDLCGVGYPHDLFHLAHSKTPPPS
jgi:hypothetical protein